MYRGLRSSTQSVVLIYAQNSTVRGAFPSGRSPIKFINTRAWAASLAIPVPLADSETALPAQFFPAALPPAPLSPAGAASGRAAVLASAGGAPPDPATPLPEAPP